MFALWASISTHCRVLIGPSLQSFQFGPLLFERQSLGQDSFVQLLSIASPLLGIIGICVIRWVDASSKHISPSHLSVLMSLRSVLLSAVIN